MAPAAAVLDRPLTVPLLIRGGIDLRRLAALLSLAFIVTAGLLKRTGYKVEDSPQAPLLAGFFAALGALYLAWNWPRRLWLEVTACGFVLRRRGRADSFRDEDVSGLTLQHRTDSKGGWRCRIIVELRRAGGVDHLCCSYAAAAGTPDPLEGFWGRLQQSLAGRAEMGAARLSGVGWTADADTLHYGRGRVLRLPLAEVRLAGFFDRQLCLWKGDEELPFLRVRGSSRNTGPLLFLIRRRLGEAPTPPLPGRPLGRRLLVRHSASRAVGLGYLAFGIWLSALASLPFVRGDRPTAVGVGESAGSLIAAVLVAVLILLWRRGRRMSIAFHEGGVAQPADGPSRRELTYDEVDTLTWEGAFDIEFIPADPRRRPLRYRNFYGLFRPHDPGLESIRDDVSFILASRWAERLARGPVSWTARLRFHLAALQCRPAGWLDSNEPALVPYDQVVFRFQGKHFLLYGRGGDHPLAQELVDGPNFYQGFALLRLIQQQLPPTSPLAAADSTSAPLPGPDDRVRLLPPGAPPPP